MNWSEISAPEMESDKWWPMDFNLNTQLKTAYLHSAALLSFWCSPGFERIQGEMKW